MRIKMRAKFNNKDKKEGLDTRMKRSFKKGNYDSSDDGFQNDNDRSINA